MAASCTTLEIAVVKAVFDKAIVDKAAMADDGVVKDVGK